MSKRIQVLEYSRAPVKDGVIHGVKIIGTRSKRGHVYPQDVLERAIGKYEDTPVYILHPNAQEESKEVRRHDDHFGSLQNVVPRYDGKIGLGLFGDLHVKQSHPLAQFVIESDGKSFGLSHNAECELNDDETEVTEILKVNSVDLEDHPATNRNLYEGTKEMTLEEFQKENGPLSDKVDALNAKVTTLLESLKEPDPKELAERVAELETQLKEAKGKKARVSALEAITDNAENGDNTCPVSHEDLLTALHQE